MSTNDPLHYRKPEPTPDVMALAEAFERALRGRSGRIGWDGPYDHGDPPSVVQIVSSAIPALGQLGWKLVPVAHERSAGAAPLDVEWLADFIVSKLDSQPYQGLHPELISMGLALAIRDEFPSLAEGTDR